ncbi:MAG: PKD domain-containing protein, partial [Bacteroidota bacterium]
LSNNIPSVIPISKERFIDSYLWEFDVRNELQTTTVENPTVAFPDVGTYEGRLIVNPGEFCEDTAFIVVNIFPDLEADFEYDYDTCIAGEVAFTNLSMAESGFITDYTWEFGDGRRSKVVDPLHQYRIPGALPVTLSIRDTNRCTDVVTKIIDYFPVPALIVISPSAETGCEPVDIFFDNLSFPIDDTYDIRWNFGDGGRSEEISPTHTYEDIGTFTVDLSIVSPIGCETDTIFPDLVTVLPSPTAGFSYSPDEPSVLSPEIQFFESARDVAAYNWDFGDGNGSAQPNPVHVYRDTGLYEVIQVVTHPNGCTDTVRQDVDIRPEVRYHLPNAFSPNNDGVNDEYFGVGIMAGAKDFIMTIWDRWGQQLFSTTDPNEGWNGRKFNTGSALPNGVYVVKVSYEGPRGDKFNLKGFATLLR